MEELVRMLIDQGAIEAGAEAWTVNAERLLLTRVPTTLTGVLQARLDGLPAPERLTLQQASVIGPVFWDRALAALDTKSHDTLPELVRRELALPRPESKHDDLREYAFKHQILHQVTYQTVLRSTRRELHGKLARWLAAQTGIRANDFLAEAARHFEQAGDVANAAEYHTPRGRACALAAGPRGRARACAAGAGAARAGTRCRHVALALAPARGARGDARVPGRPVRAAGRHRRHGRARRASRRRPAPRPRGLAAQCPGAPDRRLRHGGSGGAPGGRLGAPVGDDEIRLLAERLVSMSLAFQGRPAEGRVVGEAALAEARALGLHRVEGLCLNALAVLLALQSDDVGALQLDEQSLAAYRAVGDRRNEAIAQGNIGAGWLGLGALAAARRDLRRDCGCCGPTASGRWR
jgi:hypothetical protein